MGVDCGCTKYLGAKMWFLVEWNESEVITAIW